MTVTTTTGGEYLWNVCHDHESTNRGSGLGDFGEQFWQLRRTKFTPLVLLVPMLARQKTELFYITYSFFTESCVRISRIRKWLHAFTAHGVLRLNCPAASTTVPAMKKSIILVSALSVVVMALVSCASDSDVDPFRVHTDTTTPYHEPAPAHESHITGM